MREGVARGEDVRVAVVGRLRARREELVRAIFARVRAGAFAGAGDEDAEYVAGLRAAVGAAVEYGLEGIVRGEQWSGSIPELVLVQARRAARVGVSLDTVLRRYVVGHTLLEEFVMEEADRGELRGEREVLRGVLRAQASVLDRLLEAVTEAYRDELARAGRSPEQRRYERVRSLLEGGTVDGAGLDYDLDGWHISVIATGTGSDGGQAATQAIRRLAARSERQVLSVAQTPGTVWGWLGGTEPFAADEIAQILAGAALSSDADVAVGLGEPAQALAGWRLTHQQAQAALVVALRRQAAGTDATARYGDVALLATALKDELLARALIEVYLEPLEGTRDGGAVLRETLRAYLATERSVSSTAGSLKVARKTIESRLRAIEVRLGRTLRSCPAELEVALLLDELTRAPAPAEPAFVGRTRPRASPAQ